MSNLPFVTDEQARALEQRHVWHPFTQMRDWAGDEPLFIARGEGVRLYDTDGRAYYDANSSLWVNVHGHAHPEIDDAITEQLQRIAHSTFLGLTHTAAAALAARLAEVAPEGLTRVFYSDSGSEAVEIALKIAFQYWQHRGQPGRKRFVALADGYHGDTLGAVSVGGIPLFHGIFHPLLFPAEFAPSPADFDGAAEAAAGVRALLEAHAGEIAAVVVEPLIQGAGGMRLAPPGFLRMVRDLCTEHDTLLIVDEVATGFGRTGRLFACEHENVAPDLMCVAKGLTGGYLPLAATLATEKIYEAFLGEYRDTRTFFHGHSYTANPLACAAALASLRIFETDRVIAGLEAKISTVAQGLESIRRLAHVGDVRQCGLMVGIELALSRNPAAPYPPELRTGARVCRRARALGLITRPLGDVVVFLPPLCSTDEDLNAMLAIIEQAIRDTTEEAGA